jgi:hypothetical protein
VLVVLELLVKATMVVLEQLTQAHLVVVVVVVRVQQVR